MPNDVVDDSRVVTSIVEDTLVDSPAQILDEIHISSEGTSDVVDLLVESSTPMPDDIYVHEDDTCDFKNVLVEFSMPVEVAGYSLATLMIEDMIDMRQLLLASLHLVSHYSLLVQIVRFTHTSRMRRRSESSSKRGSIS